MSELRRMIEAADAAAGPCHLATVVDVAGSAYRRPGARMLVLPDGARLGSISGGCLERDAARAARTLTTDGPGVVSFDTRRDADGVAGSRYDLGCSGIIHVLLERLTGDADCPLRHPRGVLASGEPAVVATVYASDGDGLPAVGARLTRAQLAAAFPGVDAPARQVRDTGAAVGLEVVDGPRSCRMLLERIEPPRELWIFGAGDDARPLSAMARELDWDVTVVDKRPELVTRERFPAAHRRLCRHPREAVDDLRPSPRTAAVLMTHSLADDGAVLPWLLRNGVGYVGLLGPKARTGRLLAAMHAAGERPTPATLERLHTPVGLDLGASTPAQIAVSILAEIVADDNARDGGRLQQRRGPIHEPAAHVLIDAAQLAVERAVPSRPPAC